MLNLVSSPALLAELTERPRPADIFVPPPLVTPVAGDPNDDLVLAVAVAALADLIVSGDDDLLVVALIPGFRLLRRSGHSRSIVDDAPVTYGWYERSIGQFKTLETFVSRPPTGSAT